MSRYELSIRQTLLIQNSRYYQRAHEYYEYCKRSNNKIPGDICEYYEWNNDFYHSLCDWKNLNNNFLLGTVFLKVAICVYKSFIKVFIKKLVYVKSSWKVSKSASEAVLRMISTTQQFEFFRKLLGICSETSVMDTIFNKV